ncbi:MAG: M23 family metallopeptidase [Planctomycetota bacterium]
MKLRQLAIAFTFCATPCFAGGWGTDVNTGAGEPLVDGARAELAEIVKAAPADRTALIKAYAENRAPLLIEALKRFRNPELKPLFLLLLRSPDWQLNHRALHVLEYYGDASAIRDAWPWLGHGEARLREKAAIYCLKTWDATAPKQVAGGKPAEALAALISKEDDEQVRGAMEALAKRIAGKLVPEKVAPEFTRKLDDGLIVTPFLDGMDKVRAVAPEYVAKPNPRMGGANAAAYPVASKWAFPLCAWGKEEVNGSLQPFANLRQNGTVYHTGQDVGCCLDGAGYYAIAEGIVKFVHTGSDMGTLIVVEHNAGDGVECAVYMHGGDTVFVKVGDKVSSGQLLTTMGLSYSIENGGHFAHLHFGLYPGAFVVNHNYGYKPVSDGLEDWHDPAIWLTERVTASAPLARIHAPGKLGELLALEEYGKAYLEASKAADPVSVRVVAQIKELILVVMNRFEARRDAGYPKDAMDRLKRWVVVFKNVPGADTLETAAKWEKDASFKSVVIGEKDIAKLEAQKLEPEAAKAAWEALLRKYADTCLAGRLKAKVEAK